MTTHLAVSPVVVGREGPLAAVSDALRAVRSDGDAELLLISGPAGMGKSRMVAETHRVATEMGFSRLEGLCTPEAGVPYGALVSALRRRTRAMDGDELVALFSGPAALAATLLPELADTVGPVGAPRATDDLLAAVWRLLARLSRPHGAVLVLEDLHWADDATLRLLDYLAHERDGLPLLVMGTFRSDEMHRRHPLSALLTDLARERRATVIELAPLDQAQVTSMLSAMFDGTEVAEEFSAAVTARTEGNPFFLEELMKVMVERGDVYRTASDWERRSLADIEMPASVRDTLLARARTMDPESVRILELAAIAGAALDPSVLALAAQVDADRVDDAVREGLERQILVERRDTTPTSYAFRHALSREAFADELVGPDRRRAHQRIARAVESAHPQDLDAVAATLADHFTAANETAPAIDYAVRAARFAAATASDDEADNRFDQALRLLPESDPRVIPLLREAVGSVSIRMTPMKASFAESLARLAHEAADPVTEAGAVSMLAAHAWNEGRGNDAIELDRRAVEAVEGRDPATEAWVVARLARMLALGDQLQLDDELLARAVDLAETSGNLQAISSAYGTRMLVGSADESVFVSSYERAREAARAVGDAELEGNAYLNFGYISLWRGHFDGAQGALDKGVDFFRRVSPSDGYAPAGRAWLASLQGDYDLALDLARPLREARKLPDRTVALTALAEVSLRRADPGAAEIVAELWDAASRMGEGQRSVQAASARARLALARDDVDVALPLFWEIVGDIQTANMFGSHWPFSPDLAAALAAEGRVGALTDWVEVVERITAIDENPHNQAARSLAVAQLRSLTATAAEASAAFEDAVARYSTVGAPARMAEALCGLARVEARGGNLDRAETALTDAARISDDLRADQLRMLVDETRRSALSRPVLATLLFTDIVGSTEAAVALGDRAWRERLELHHGIVRRELARSGGREIDTAGDGFLAAFDSPAAGVRCATAAQNALLDAGIGIRAGLHTGECQESGGKLTGVTVHIAARVSAMAGSGEIVVSSTVRDLVAGSGLEFVDRGTHELKGVPGVWHLYAVDRGLVGSAG